MGTDAHVIVVGNPSLEVDALERLRLLESRWTRFDDGSELSRLNAATGRVVVLSPDTYAVIDRAVAGWHLTGGRFDPTVLDAVHAAGYTRSFEQLSGADEPPARSEASPGCAEIELFPLSRAVRLPPGVRLDLGGIGKGWAADVVAGELLASGAEGVCINLGGDLRVAGEAPSDAGWIIAIDNPYRPGHPLRSIGLAAGAVATSSRLRRRWMRAGHEMHHIIDPRTGRPSTTTIAAVTIVAAEAWVAEVMATAMLLDPADSSALDRVGASALLIGAEGELRATAGFEAFAA
jgi:thiamine biosynthesis lipoprotein